MGDVSFSDVMRNSKNVHSFFVSFGEMRSGIGCVHSYCAPVSKWTHCLQECSSNLHFGHWPLGSNPGVRIVPQFEQRARDPPHHARRARAHLILKRLGDV